METQNGIIDGILEKEWPMFRTVNGETRADCQDDRAMFEAMRRAQFSAWSEKAAESYLLDLTAAGQTGRNLVREKYIRMMKSTDPTGYEAFCKELPALTPGQEQLIGEIWTHLLAQTERLREQFPAVALGGRPLRAAEEAEGWASIETYQCGELATYSEETLRELLAHILTLEEEGKDLARLIQERSVMAMGYRSLEDAERQISFRFIQEMGGGECTSCGVFEDRCY